MSDRPIAKLGGKTILEAANIPNIDSIAAKGRLGLFKTVPDDLPPGSDVANLAVFGYDARAVYQGRAVLEAASMGVQLADDDMALRCNLICVEDGKIKNHSAGHISNEEAYELIEALNNELATDHIRFHAGVSYRHLLVIKNGISALNCTPPHDVPGTPYEDVLVKPLSSEAVETADLLNDLIQKSVRILENHPVNIKRKQQGKDMGNYIWPWSPGYKPAMKTYQELFGLSGAVISAVDLIFGIGVYAGLQPIMVEGATGLYDTNYEGKARAAVEALKNNDFVYLHVEATDEAGHEGNVDLKIKALEYLDSRIVKYVWDETRNFDEPVAIAILPDHATPCEIRTHTREAVPFIIYRPDMQPDNVQIYTEKAAADGVYSTIEGTQFVEKLFGM